MPPLLIPTHLSSLSLFEGSHPPIYQPSRHSVNAENNAHVLQVAGTIKAFKEHVPQPTLDDLSQLNQVLSDHVKRTLKKTETKRRALEKTLVAAGV